jgi:MFS transporter, FHS family, L-fucose permease
MAFTATSPTQTSVATESGNEPSYTSALLSLMVLFFMMGFITCLNDILIPYLKAAFNLSFVEGNLINLCFFGAYFVMGIPAGSLVAKVGYKGGMLAGFLVAALGCFLFYPAAEMRSYPLFLGSLFVLASGIVLLQVAGNPYVAILGPARSAPARLTLTQAFNSLGTTIAPLLGASLILSRLPKIEGVSAEAIDVSAVQMPYVYIACVLIAISGLLAMLKLPVITPAGVEGDVQDSNRRAYHYRHLVLGCVGIFAYVGAEVAIGSHIVSYLGLKEVMAFTPEAAGKMIAYYWGGAMVGRFIGAWALNKFNPGKLLGFNAVGAIVLVLVSIATSGEVAMYSLLAVGLMNSFMFATIFTLAVAGLGRHTQEASGLLNVAIVGGAIVPLLFGFMADSSSLQLAFILPVICYAYILWYGISGHKPVAVKAIA